MKNKYAAAIIAWLFGGFGIHHFYLGNIKRGVLFLLFFWTFLPALIAIFESIILITMNDKDFDKKYNSK